MTGRETYCPTDMKPTLVARLRKGARIPLVRELSPPSHVVDSLLPQPAVPEGDCFIVINRRGQCWDGVSWTASWCDAVKFRRPDPAFELCEEAAGEAEQTTGESGMVCYIPPDTPASFLLAAIPDLSQVDLRDFARKPDVC
jgi:hypothetical protein